MSPVDWAPLPDAWAEGAKAGLSECVGHPVAVEPGVLQAGARDELLGAGEPLLVVPLTTTGDDPQPVFLLVPRELAAGLAAARTGESPDEEGEGALPEAAQAAFEECVGVCAAVLGRVFEAQGELPGIAAQASRFAAAGEVEAAGLSAGDYRRQAFQLALDDGTSGELSLWLPEAAAAGWFGGAPEGSGGERLPLAVIHPDAAVRDQVEDLAEVLGRAVWSLDPAEFGPHSFDELSEAAAVIVAWDLGGVSGLELLDSLRRDPRTAGRPVAVATERPTRDSVLAALRWGAATVLTLPFEADEIGRRLGLAR